ncbi:MAG TPA: aminotransferase class I/II-fold pyridoxal phosphate-dependent enzyme, partial [Oceanospirillales bacterium]|nr:aminotransferase class I/II-fold pyridoxal phosphate-dependent enzyme [Oceanospirillales bacterium]
TLTHSQLNRIIKLCQKYDVWLLSDEVFRGLEHDKKDQLPAVADIYAKGISIAVISKAFALGGVRIGWLACKNKQILARIIEIKAYLSICNSQFDEKIASVILQKPKLILNRHLKIINNNKQLLNNFKVICGYKISFFTPKTGCCLFAKIEAKITASQLVDLVADKCNYLLYPDELFFSQSNAVRIGFGNNQFPKFIKEVTL